MDNEVKEGDIGMKDALLIALVLGLLFGMCLAMGWAAEEVAKEKRAQEPAAQQEKLPADERPEEERSDRNQPAHIVKARHSGRGDVPDDPHDGDLSALLAAAGVNDMFAEGNSHLFLFDCATTAVMEDVPACLDPHLPSTTPP